MSPCQLRWIIAFLSALLWTEATANDSNDVSGLSPIKALGNDVLEAGGIRFNARTKTATFPAAVNMRRGALEYLLVGTAGKTHESLLVTTIEPAQLHTVMLLLGAKGAPPEHPAGPASAITKDSLQGVSPLAGDRISISISWKKGDIEQHVPAEDLIRNEKTHRPMSRGPWLYNGSYIFEGHFLAQEDQSFAALVNDPEALINNPRPGNDDDEIWLPNPKKIDALHTPLEITITLLPGSPASSQKP